MPKAASSVPRWRGTGEPRGVQEPSHVRKSIAETWEVCRPPRLLHAERNAFHVGSTRSLSAMSTLQIRSESTKGLDRAISIETSIPPVLDDDMESDTACRLFNLLHVQLNLAGRFHRGRHDCGRRSRLGETRTRRRAPASPIGRIMSSFARSSTAPVYRSTTGQPVGIRGIGAGKWRSIRMALSP